MAMFTHSTIKKNIFFENDMTHRDNDVTLNSWICGMWGHTD